MTRVTRVQYAPKPIRQRLTFQGHLIGCTDTSFAMGADAATLGGLIVSEAQVRALSDEARPDPASPGLNLAQLDRVAWRLHVDFFNRTNDTFPDLLEELDARAPVVAQLWYPGIGGNPIGHALYLRSRSGGRIKGVDPVKGVYGTWPEAQVQQAMRTFADKHNVAGLLWGAFRRTPWLARNQE